MRAQSASLESALPPSGPMAHFAEIYRLVAVQFLTIYIYVQERKANSPCPMRTILALRDICLSGFGCNGRAKEQRNA